MLRSHTQLGDVPQASHLYGASDYGVGAAEEQILLKRGTQGQGHHHE